MSLELIILLVILILFVILVFGTILIFLKQKRLNKSETLNLSDKQINKKNQIMDRKIDNLNNSIQEYQLAKQNYKDKLLSISKLSEQEIKNELINEISSQYKQEINENLAELKKDANIKSACILLNTMQSLAEPLIQENSTTSINIKDDQIKGRLIGREGRNKRCFELVTGTDLVIEKDSNFVTISSYHPIRREIAKLLLDELINAKSIDPTKIETLFEAKKEQFNQHLIDVGKDLIENKLNIYDLDPQVYQYVGKLKYRNSYGQNVLDHCYECACIASSLAMALNLDTKKAIKCALLHDLGKSVDYEVNKNHVDVGAELANELGLDYEIINAIESHHGSKATNNIYSEITKLADYISSGRPGARVNSSEEYFARMEEIEKIVDAFKEIKKSYVVKSGRHLRVIVNPKLVADSEIELLAKKIKHVIEENDMLKGFNIKVTIIRENRFEFETENKNIQ